MPTTIPTAEDHLRVKSILQFVRRFLLVLAFAHFASVPILYWMISSQPLSLKLSYYIVALTSSGFTLFALWVLSHHLKELSTSLLLLTVLMVEILALVYEANDLGHGGTRFLLLLPLIAPFICGRNFGYVFAGLGMAGITIIQSLPTHSSWNNEALSQTALLALGLTLSSYFSESLWLVLKQKEDAVLKSLAIAKEKTLLLESWITQMAEASSMLDSVQISTSTPLSTPDTPAAIALSKSIENMHRKLSSYWASLVLKDRMESLGVLASGLAHELNTPLTTLKFMIDQEASALPPSVKANLLNEINRMGRITREFLAFSKPKDGCMTMDLNTVIRDCLAQFRLTSEIDARVLSHLSAKPALIDGNQSLLEQVVINLIRNAMDARKPETTAEITITTRTEGELIILLVKDNGVGIPSSILKDVLNPFFTTKGPNQGTGLGLFIVHEIIKQHHGEMSIQSEVNHGATIEIRLPIASVQSERKAA